jgi:hypothetical protein
MLDRRNWLRAGLTLALLACGSCGGVSSRLNTVQQPTGSGPIDFQVHNGTDVSISNLYMAKTEVADRALKLEPGSPEEAQLWGADRLTAALGVGDRERITVSEPGRWDVRALDRDGRYQHVSGLRLEPGGKYILELGEGGWRYQQ